MPNKVERIKTLPPELVEGAILDIGRMNDGMEQQAHRIDENAPLLALDLLSEAYQTPLMRRELSKGSALFTPSS